MKAVFPGRVTQHGDLLAVFVFLGGEDAAQQRLHSQSRNTPAVRREAFTWAGSPVPDKLVSGELISAQGGKALFSRV